MIDLILDTKSWMLDEPLGVLPVSYQVSSIEHRLLSIHLSHHDIDAAEDHHHVGYGVTETQILEHG